MTDAFDLSTSAAPAAENPAIQRLLTMADEAVSMERSVEELEQTLSDLKKQLNKLKTVDLPDAMAECGLPKFTHKSGVELAVEDFVSGSLPKDDQKRRDALSWLETHEAEALIKTEVNLTFGKSEHNRALSLVAQLADAGYDVSTQSGVHPQTLIAHVKECMRAGEEVPLETLGLYAGRIVKIKQPRKSARKAGGM